MAPPLRWCLKKIMLPAGDIERCKTDQKYRINAIGELVHHCIKETMALKPSWHCFTCQGNVKTFNLIPTSDQAETR